MIERKPLKHNRWEYAIPVLAITSLVISCVIISSKKYFWNDELFSYYFLSDPSFSKMLIAFHDKINNTPILYFLLGWVWDKIFGSSELSYRLFSSLSVCVALATIWVVLRRTYRFWPTSIGTLGVFCTSSIIIFQNAEARMYGLFLAVCALALPFYDTYCRKQKPSYKSLVLHACVHIAIIHTHLFGPFYSGAILLSLILRDRYFKVFRPKIYLSIILSWLSFLLYIPSFLNQADAGKPRTWLPIPTLDDLITFYDLSPFLKLTVLPALVFISVLQLISGSQGVRSTEASKKDSPDRNSEFSLILFACIFTILPVFIWIFSRTLKPIFWDRYMIPSAIGIAVLLTYGSSRLISTPVINNILNDTKRKTAKIIRGVIVTTGLTILTACLLWQPVKYAKQLPPESRPGSLDNVHGYSNLPIVVESSGLFLERQFYSPLRDKYFIILDWEAASDPRSGVWPPQQFKHLSALKRNYPNLFKNNILTTGEFLGKYDRFLVMQDPNDTLPCPLVPTGLYFARNWIQMECPQWVGMRLLNNAAYKVTSVNKTSWSNLLLVEKNKKNL